MKIKLVAIDMDGTFLDDDKNIPEENLKALRECAALGVEVVPATGRAIRVIPEEIRNLPGVRYAITTNGAAVADLRDGTIVDSRRLPLDLAVKVLEMARKSPDDIMYDAYVDGVAYSMDCFMQNIRRYAATPGMELLIRKTRKTVDDNIEYVRGLNTDVDKINMYFTDMEARKRMRESLLAVPGLSVTSSIVNNLEINAAGADKGGALLRLAAALGIDEKETMAMGDGENDISMIQAAGIGVAMENGEENVKAEADYITVTNNEAGVAAAIRKFVLS